MISYGNIDWGMSKRGCVLAQLASDVGAIELRVVDAGGLAEIAGTLRLVRSQLEQAGRMERNGADHVPDWDDIRGLAPDATGDVASEDFVRKSRSDWR